MALLNWNMRRWRWSMVVFVAAAVAATAAAQTLTRERDVQAVFLLNLTRFVRWPEGAFPAGDAPLVIGVLADDPIGAVLEEAARGEATGKHPLAIRWIRSAADLEGCHVVYFSKDQMAEGVQMIPLLRSKSVLTVSDAEGFLPLGGHVQMYSRAGQMKLRLDADNLKRGDLTASAQLLRVAEVVGGEGPRRGGMLGLPVRQGFVAWPRAWALPASGRVPTRHGVT